MRALAPSESELALLKTLALPVQDEHPDRAGWWSWRSVRADPRTYPAYKKQTHQKFHAAGTGLVSKGLARKRHRGSSGGWTEYRITNTGRAWTGPENQEQETGP